MRENGSVPDPKRISRDIRGNREEEIRGREREQRQSDIQREVR